MTRPPFDLRRLRHFVTVAEQRSFRGSAEALHVSQPSLTRQIQLLEEQLGVTLLKRGPRGVELTPAGEQFYGDATRILQMSVQAAEHAQLAAQGQMGRLDIGIFGSAVFHAIPRIVLGFRSRYPGVKVALHSMDRTAQVQALREQRLNVGFNWFFRGDSQIAGEVVTSETLRVVVQEQHPLAERDVLSIDDLRGEPLIVFPRVGRPNFADHVLFLCRQAGFEPTIAEEVDDVVTAVALVSSGFGLSVVVDAASRIVAPGVRFIPLEHVPGMKVDLSLMYRREDDSPLLQAFLAEARAYGGNGKRAAQK